MVVVFVAVVLVVAAAAVDESEVLQQLAAFGGDQVHYGGSSHSVGISELLFLPPDVPELCGQLYHAQPVGSRVKDDVAGFTRGEPL